MTDIAEMRNIGPRSAEWLTSVGIDTVEEIERLGVVEAYLRTKAAYPKQVSLNLLYGLHAGMLDIDWKDMPEGMKRELRERAGD